jgi:hypothetical protein
VRRHCARTAITDYWNKDASSEHLSPLVHDGTAWQHIAITYNANNSKALYIDGVLMSTGHDENVGPSNQKLWDGSLARDFGAVEIGGGDGVEGLGWNPVCNNAVGAMQDFQVRGAQPTLSSRTVCRFVRYLVVRFATHALQHPPERPRPRPCTAAPTRATPLRLTPAAPCRRFYPLHATQVYNYVLSDATIASLSGGSCALT